jgi:hypothetical protein
MLADFLLFAVIFLPGAFLALCLLANFIIMTCLISKRVR